jgi:hypothetical protein
VYSKQNESRFTQDRSIHKPEPSISSGDRRTDPNGRVSRHRPHKSVRWSLRTSFGCGSSRSLRMGGGERGECQRPDVCEALIATVRMRKDEKYTTFAFPRSITAQDPLSKRSRPSILCPLHLPLHQSASQRLVFVRRSVGGRTGGLLMSNGAMSHLPSLLSLCLFSTSSLTRGRVSSPGSFHRKKPLTPAPNGTIFLNNAHDEGLNRRLGRGARCLILKGLPNG